MCSNNMASARVILKTNQTKIKGGYKSGRKGVTHNSKSDLPLIHVPSTYGPANVGTWLW